MSIYGNLAGLPAGAKHYSHISYLSHASEKPAVKQVYPMLVFAGNGLCQSADTGFAVPDGEMVEEIFQRIEYGDAVGVDIPAYVPVP